MLPRLGSDLRCSRACSQQGVHSQKYVPFIRLGQGETPISGSHQPHRTLGRAPCRVHEHCSMPVTGCVATARTLMFLRRPDGATEMV
jgi:hypothetical protein